MSKVMQCCMKPSLNQFNMKVMSDETEKMVKKEKDPLLEKSPNTEFFLPVFSRTWTEPEKFRKTPDQKNYSDNFYVVYVPRDILGNRISKQLSLESTLDAETQYFDKFDWIGFWWDCVYSLENSNKPILVNCMPYVPSFLKRSSWLSALYALILSGPHALFM